VAENVLALFTAKSVATVLADGGTQSWVLNRPRAKACKYAILCRNARSPYVEGSEPHRSAFLIGRVKDVVPSTESDGRWLVQFSEYATCAVPDQWEGRNPVNYWTTDDSPHIDFDKLDFQPMPGQATPSPRTAEPQLMTLADAKAGLARTFNVPPSAIEITIRG
jgi:hypothetical protein